MNKLPFEEVKRTVLIKKEEKTDVKYGKDLSKRTVEELINYCVININKYKGPTSHQVSDYVQKILEIKKAGHGGSLDPAVTGVLPIATERATRIVQTLLKAGKEYVALMHLHKEVDEDKIRKSAEEFIGKIKQIPPVRSAVKRVEREREIYYLEILEIDNQDVLFRIGCEAGTYIRKFIHDWGRKLKIGAHMQQLIRTKAGPFKIENAYTLHDLKDAYEFYKEGNEEEIRRILLNIEFSTNHLSKIWVFDNCVDSLAHGADLSIPGVSKLESKIKENDLVAIFSLKNELICLGTALIESEKVLKQEKGKFVRTTKVFMERNIYPKRVIGEKNE